MPTNMHSSSVPSNCGTSSQAEAGQCRTGSNRMLRYTSVSVGVSYPNCGSDTRLHMTLKISQEMGDHISPQSGSFNSPGDFDDSSHHCMQPTDMLTRMSWQAAGVCTDHQEPATCFPVEFPESCPKASSNIWSNN